jgi:hypothetical protein
MKVLKVERRIKQLETLLGANSVRNKRIKDKIRILKKELYVLDPSRKPPSGWVLPTVMGFLSNLKAKAMETMNYFRRAKNQMSQNTKADSESDSDSDDSDSDDSDDSEESLCDIDADFDALNQICGASAETSANPDADFAALNQICGAPAETVETGPSPEVAPAAPAAPDLAITDSKAEFEEDLALEALCREETLLDVDADFPDMDPPAPSTNGADPAPVVDIVERQKSREEFPRSTEPDSAASVLPEHFMRGTICSNQPALPRSETEESDFSELEI